MTERLSSIVVAIPVKDEAERIANCLRALSMQSGISQHQIVLLLNNCMDDSAAVVRDLVPNLPISVHQLEVTLPPEHANAGYARRLAMQAAENFVAPRGVLLTTDADACVYPDWIANNLLALREGADAVAGCIEIDPAEAALIPSKLHEDDARECAYAALLDEIHARLDWDPADPWPRHSEQSGASIAVSVDAYRRAGGIPGVALGEDRAFFEALRRIDARIRHTPKVRVVVSGRILGRAAGGMADTIRRRIVKPDDMLDDRLEPALNAAWRARLRRFVRKAWSTRDAIAPLMPSLSQTLLMPSVEIWKLFSLPHFGAAWSAIETRSTTLVKRRVPVVDLEHETKQALSILDAYFQRRRGVSSYAPAGPVGIPVLDVAGADSTRPRKLPYNARPLRRPGMGSRFGRSNEPAGSVPLATSWTESAQPHDGYRAD
jgi:GT2 family glycosyltransferase